MLCKLRMSGSSPVVLEVEKCILDECRSFAQAAVGALSVSSFCAEVPSKSEVESLLPVSTLSSVGLSTRVYPKERVVFFRTASDLTCCILESGCSPNASRTGNLLTASNKESFLP